MIENRVAGIMRERGINVSQLSERAGITYRSAHGLYTATSQRIDLPTLAKVCEVLQVQVGDLFVYVPAK